MNVNDCNEGDCKWYDYVVNFIADKTDKDNYCFVRFKYTDK